METIKIFDKEFRLFISEKKIRKAIHEIASKLNRDLKGKQVVFLGILNGAFMFAADLFREIHIPCRISFVKMASYSGTTSSGSVQQLIGLAEDIQGKTVVIVEDIVDTGITLDTIIRQLKGYEPAEILVASLLFKPEACKFKVQIDYTGIEIPNDFVIGYGLDYNGYGRNMADIYRVHNS